MTRLDLLSRRTAIEQFAHRTAGAAGHDVRINNLIVGVGSKLTATR